jgi:hypothetical protein
MAIVLAAGCTPWPFLSDPRARRFALNRSVKRRLCKKGCAARCRAVSAALSRVPLPIRPQYVTPNVADRLKVDSRSSSASFSLAQQLADAFALILESPSRVSYKNPSKALTLPESEIVHDINSKRLE